MSDVQTIQPIWKDWRGQKPLLGLSAWFHRCVVVVCLSFSFLIKTGSFFSVLCDLLVSLKVKRVCPWGTHQLGGEGFSGRRLPRDPART